MWEAGNFTDYDLLDFSDYNLTASNLTASKHCPENLRFYKHMTAVSHRKILHRLVEKSIFSGLRDFILPFSTLQYWDDSVLLPSHN